MGNRLCEKTTAMPNERKEGANFTVSHALLQVFILFAINYSDKKTSNTKVLDVLLSAIRLNPLKG
ncbi:hypothetical protein GCM10011607_26180 [Shewanella inventionis]|uniref:Uncharacterized protein n=1 Tax=Shewanella inventionis TaxID=1738770 RepID=A0ABQ1JB14_9GAMM|nr:hypothetical protein GCM10011607_26180 [Shewanella inventionis]